MKEYTYQWNPENAEDETLPILKITKSSAIGAYKWCPKKYEFSYIERLPQDTTEPMIKGTIVHNTREEFFNEFDVAKAENMSHSELIEYNIGLHPIDEYGDIYKNMATFEAGRFVEARDAGKLETYVPVINEVMLDAEIVIEADACPKVGLLRRDYTIHLQGIIDRMFIDDGKYVPIELKTGLWADWKTGDRRKEMAFYKFLVENANQESLDAAGIDRDIPITHWGWYYPESNHIHVEPVKKASMSSLTRLFVNMIKSYEDDNFEAKYYYKTCQHCSFYPICEKAQEDVWL
jgi:CRISPR/Cas system-associated exonuclease Cas4 (RecB family)